MIRIFSIKPFSGSPTDGIDNVNSAVFKRLDLARIEFHSEMADGILEEGSIKKLAMGPRGGIRKIIHKIILLRRMNPEYLFGIGTVSDVVFILAKPRRTKYVIAWHTVLFKNSSSWRVRTPWFLRVFIFNRADFIITVSTFSADAIRHFFPHKKVIVILNGVDVTLFDTVRGDQGYLHEKYHIDFSKPVMVFVGAMSERKRPDIFFKLSEDFPGANFVAVGRDPVGWDFLRSPRSAHFQWIESMPREDIARLFAASRIFVFPSLNDASAAVILEAMASGCVPIVSRSGGSPEFFKEGVSGFSIPVDDEEIAAFSQRIKLLLGDAVFDPAR